MKLSHSNNTYVAMTPVIARTVVKGLPGRATNQRPKDPREPQDNISISSGHFTFSAPYGHGSRTSLLIRTQLRSTCTLQTSPRGNELAISFVATTSLATLSLSAHSYSCAAALRRSHRRAIAVLGGTLSRQDREGSVL